LTRNLVYVLLLLGAAALVFYLVKYRSTGTLNPNEKNFAVTDTAAIGKIFIADMEGHKIELTRSGTQWIMNGKQPARKDITNLLLNTFRTMAVRYPVPKTARENVVKEMSATNRKVILYDLKGEPIKTIYVGHTPLDNIGNYMLLEGANDPYVVEIPGFHGSLETRFTTDTLDMRSRTVIAVPFESLATFSVVYNDTPDSSFALDFTQSDSFRVYNPLSGNALPRRAVSKEKVFAFTSFLKEVNCEAYETNNPIKATVLAQRPFCTVTVTQRDGKKSLIDCYRKPVDRRTKEQADESGNPLPYDTDRFYGLVDGTDFVLLQQFHFGRLLKNVDYFRA
jgi:hypothetical protein